MYASFCWGGFVPHAIDTINVDECPRGPGWFKRVGYSFLASPTHPCSLGGTAILKSGTLARGGVDGDGSSDEFDYDRVGPQEAGRELGDFIIELKQRGTLSAKQACVLAFWAHKAGAIGIVAKLAYSPDKQSGRFSRHFDAVVGCGPSALDFYTLQTPGHSRHRANRVSMGK